MVATRFQCSSASRKFLNSDLRRKPNCCISVSVLFSEPKIPQSPSPSAPTHAVGVSVLFSEPKIPQSLNQTANSANRLVSVLFSEPKIPQSNDDHFNQNRALQFQCSSASRKFLNSSAETHLANRLTRGFSALQRAENSSIVSGNAALLRTNNGFSALQRAENSSI